MVNDANQLLLPDVDDDVVVVVVVDCNIHKDDGSRRCDTGRRNDDKSGAMATNAIVAVTNIWKTPSTTETITIVIMTRIGLYS